MAIDASSGRPVEDAGAEGDSRKQREEEQNQKNKNTSSCEDPKRTRTDELVERTSVPRVFSRSSWPEEDAVSTALPTVALSRSAASVVRQLATIGSLLATSSASRPVARKPFCPTDSPIATRELSPHSPSHVERSTQPQHQRRHDARSSPTSTLYVRHAAPVFMTSQPTPRDRIAPEAWIRETVARAGAEDHDLGFERENRFDVCT